MTDEELAVHFEHPLTADERAHLTAALRPGIVFTEGPSLPEPARYRILVSGRPSHARPSMQARILRR